MTEDTQSNHDHFLLGFHGGHEDHELRSMSYVRLCSELESTTIGTTKFMLLEAEQRRRDSSQTTEPTNPKEHHAAKEPPEPSNKKDGWADKALGKIAISVAGTVVASYLLWLFRAHLGFP